MTDQTDANGASDDIIARIRKVLALTTSPNPHEAASAAAKVQELLLIHNLSLMDVKESADDQRSGSITITREEYQYANSRYSPLKSWKESLGWGIGKYYNIEVLRSWDKLKLSMIGTADNIHAFRMTYEWLVSQFEVMAAGGWKDYVAEVKSEGYKPDDPLVYRANFFNAAVGEVVRRIRANHEQLSDQYAGTMALVVRHDEAIKQWMEGEGIEVRRAHDSRGGSAYNSHAINAGRKAGAMADIGTGKMPKPRGVLT